MYPNGTAGVLRDPPPPTKPAVRHDVEVLSSWLATLHYEEYIPFFLQAGYDMPTITRMTPEDLTAIGITKPNHRRKLKAEIAKLNISDGIPEYKPDSLLEWLQLLRLEDYFDTLCQQNCSTIDKVTDLTWEDLEDIGIQKLGHQKRILLAIKRIEDINHGRRPNLYPQSTVQSRACNSSSGSSTFPRPSTLVNTQPLLYPCQEIAISTHRPKSSPSTDSIPEMKTFQQSPLREDNLFLQAVHNSAQNIATSQLQNGLTNNVVSPTRVRSLESLHAENSSAMQYQKINASILQNVSTSNISSSVQHQNTTSMANNMMQSNVCSTNMNNSMHHPSVSTSSMNNYMQQNPGSLAVSSYATSSMQHPNCSSSSTSSFQQQNASSLSINNSSMQQQNGGILNMSNHQTITSSSMTNSLPQAPINSVPSSQPQAETVAEPPKTQTKDWRVTDLDGEYDYECEGTATLNRPKGLVRLRPMAKITAKTREEIAEAIMDIPDSEFKSLINNQSRALDGWSSLDGSPRHGPSTVPRSATLKRAPPPPPPKRNPSGKAAPPEPREPPQVPKRNVKSTSDAEVSDFPPPPSPLPSAVEDKPEGSDSKDELFCNPLFRQRRKDSSDSASGGVDASALPFANETVGTIKQKSARPYPSLPMNASQLRAVQKSKNSASKVEHESDVTPEAISPGDVIDDIENMLANLSDQLDLMLDEEVKK
ncbi:hypothetical protein JTE90_014109 [Oedothorax gibbosus]|uniref:SAM domain-containing protein n=1 Tax=Oedothorax gibbosus TaxID=931172 RepID=A0AAV6V9E2_9ARAC|nr:hypothetical protein JTE90_014109 [Oedothorax gibbosus]